MRNERFVKVVTWIAVAALGMSVIASLVGLFT